MTKQYYQIRQILRKKLKEMEPLDRYTTFKIGGPADLFYNAETHDELINAVVTARTCNIPFFLLGGGTNLLVSDKGFRGLVIKNSTRIISVKGIRGSYSNTLLQKHVYVEVDSGVLFNKFVRITIEEGLSGIEMHLGLPGTVGGALYNNSKWTKPPSFVGDSVYQATILTPQNSIVVQTQSYFRFGYDTSYIQQTKDIVLRAVFLFSKSRNEDLWGVANTSIAYRNSTQPQGVKTAGCIFQNISKTDAFAIPTPNHSTSAGFLLDHAGVKGLRVGDAQFSTVHANFIINSGKATAEDVIKLVDIARKRVKEQFGVTLKEEIQIIGDFTVN